MDKSDTEKLQKAVDDRNVVKLLYNGQPRTVEPLAVKNETMLIGTQTGGSTSGGRSLPGWFQCPISAIEDLEVTDETFTRVPDNFDPNEYK